MLHPFPPNSHDPMSFCAENISPFLAAIVQFFSPLSFPTSNTPTSYSSQIIPSKLKGCKCLQEKGRKDGGNKNIVMGFIKVNLNAAKVWLWTWNQHSTDNYSINHPGRKIDINIQKWKTEKCVTINVDGLTPDCQWDRLYFRKESSCKSWFLLESMQKTRKNNHVHLQKIPGGCEVCSNTLYDTLSIQEKMKGNAVWFDFSFRGLNSSWHAPRNRPSFWLLWIWPTGLFSLGDQSVSFHFY